jgi:hypothetical protein
MMNQGVERSLGAARQATIQSASLRLLAGHVIVRWAEFLELCVFLSFFMVFLEFWCEFLLPFMFHDAMLRKISFAIN